jgi:SecD/SecF fusion protein
LTARRRNLFILLVVGGLLAASIFAITSKPTRLGLDLRGGVELVYEARPGPGQDVVEPEALERAIEVMRDRVDQLGVAEPEIQRSGENQISVGLPDVENADQAQRQVGQVAQMYFYDWEPNVIGPSGRPEPTNPEVTGGPQAGRGPGAITRFEALQRAAQRPAITEGNRSHDGQYYAVDEENEEVLAGPEDSERELQEALDAAELRPEVRERAETLKVEPGTVIVRAEQADDIPEDQKADLWYVLADNIALRGDDIRNPEQQFDQGAGGSGQPVVSFEFTSEGRETWRNVTREIAQRGQSQQIPGTSPQEAAQHFAIVLDDELISVPFIDFVQNPRGIDGGQGSQIEGGFTIQSAQELANLLKTGALPVRLSLISQSQVSATLGAQSLNQGLYAGIGGFLVVALFLLAFYRILGLIAVIALGLYGAYFFALIKLIPVTLTLPGIAGLVLTLGVAADANIVIFERVKEEIRAGRSVPAGIKAGYTKGLTAIIDANVVTVMVAFILFVLATAGVKGFAFVLGVGTLVSLFTAVLATQAILGTLGQSRLLARPSALGAAPPKRRFRMDFMGASKWFFSASGVILIICALAIGGKGVSFGIDFESGTRIRAALEQTTNEAGVRNVISQAGVTDVKIQRVTDEELGSNAFQISTGELSPDQVTGVTRALGDEFGLAQAPDTQSIGPTFGATVAKNAIIAIIASLLVISVYLALRFEWKYAVPVLIATTHDILIVSGIYALTDREVTTATVAALLTILGYSLYDTIIVFDRIRENVPRMPRATFSQITNRSVSEVIVRSLATSFSTLLPVLALLLFGGETLTDFAFALLVGVASGTYSSVFIATPVLAHWKEREPIYRRRRAMLDREHDGDIPAYADVSSDRDPGAAARKPRRRITAPDDPQRQVSREEFDDMVRDLHADEPKAGTAVADPVPEPPGPAGAPAPDADPSELYMKSDGKRRGDKERKRNRKHGRPR